MSYDLAVWEGEPPSDDRAGCAAYLRLYETYLGDESTEVDPTRAIRSYVEALREHWGDNGDGGLDPWSAGPLQGEASGPIIYFTMRFSVAEEASARAASTAAARGLICFDPQLEVLRPTAEERSG